MEKRIDRSNSLKNSLNIDVYSNAIVLAFFLVMHNFHAISQSNISFSSYLSDSKINVIVVMNICFNVFVV